MRKSLKSLIRNVEAYAQDRGIPILGVARAEELNSKAPEGFRPQDMMAGAKSVLIFAKPLPQAVFQTPENLDNMFYTRSAYTYYQRVSGGSEKQVYDVDAARERVENHAHHFTDLITNILDEAELQKIEDIDCPWPEIDYTLFRRRQGPES